MFFILIVKLFKSIVPTRYNGRPGIPIEVALIFTLILDLQYINFPFLVIDLGYIDILIK